MRKKNVRIGTALMAALALALALILTACPQITGNDNGGTTGCTVTFNTGGGSAIAPLTVNTGSLANRPADPVKEGYHFDNWYTAAAGGSVVSWPITVNANITVYARWIERENPSIRFTVIFDTVEGSAIAPLTVNTGSLANRPADPVKEGYYFDNWYTAATGGSVVSWPITVNANITVYARWTEAEIPITRFTVTFDTGGGNYIDPLMVNTGSWVDRPADPVKEGYHFDNWYTAATGGWVVSWPITVNANITVYARWTEAETPITRFTVTFDTGGGSAITPLTVDAGSTVNQPADPTKEGYRFDNWYTATTGGWVVSWPLTVSENTTVYARWIAQYTVTFDTGGGSAITPLTVDAGSWVDRPADPVKEGYHFDNWYTATTGGWVVSWPLTVSENTTVYTRWIAQYTVTFDTDGGSAITPLTVDAGSWVDRPADPVKEGYHFDNWYTATTGGWVVSWPLTVSENTTVYARWIAQYTVTFDTDGGSYLDPLTVDAGSWVNQPANPAKEGYHFDNWYTAATGGWAVSWPLTVSENTTVYTRWIALYTVTFDTDGGSYLDPLTMEAGSTVNQPVDPTKWGYRFDNWYTAATGGSAASWPLTVSESTTVYARWILIGQGSIQAVFSGLPQDESTNLTGTGGGTLSWTNGTLDISVPAENFPGASWQWYLDNAPLSGATTAALNKPGSDFTPGRHEVTVEIRTADNKVYSKTLRFTVVQ